MLVVSEFPKCRRKIYLKLHSKSEVVCLKKYNKVVIQILGVFQLQTTAYNIQI